MPRSAGVKAKVERAAVDLFAANGFDGVSIADIAAAAGVSQGALYRHYPSKEELGWALFSTAYLRTGEQLDRIRARRRRLEHRMRRARDRSPGVLPARCAISNRQLRRVRRLRIAAW